MGKLKLTESQVVMLQSLENTLPKKKVLKLTTEQYNRLFEEFDFKMPPKPTRASEKTSRHFKKAEKQMPKGEELKFEEELLGHPIGGAGGDEYNPQSEIENQKTFKSFNEEALNEPVALDVIDFGNGVISFLKSLLTDPSDEILPSTLKGLGLTKDELMEEMVTIGMIGRAILNGRKVIRVMKDDFVNNIKKLYDKFVEIPDTNEMVKPIQMGNDIELPESNDKVAKAFKTPFEKKGVKPSPEQIKKNLKTKRDAELKRRQSEASNVPLGANQDPNSPWNDDRNIAKGKEANQYLFKLLYYGSEHAIFVRDGKYYLFNVDSFDNSDYAEYADREEQYYGRDEDGEPMVDYGEFEVDEYVIDNFVNDNYKELEFGRGFSDFENGAQFVEFDQELVSNLMGLAKFMIDKGYSPKKGEELLTVLSSMNVSETTTAAGSSGAFVGKMGMNAPITRVTSMSPENEMKNITEKSKKKKKNKAQQMSQSEKPVEKDKQGLQTVQVTQQDIQNAMGKHNVYTDRKKEKSKYAGRKDKHKGKMLGEYDGAENNELADLKHKFFQHPTLGSFVVVDVRSKNEDDEKLSYLITLEGEGGEQLDSDLIYAYEKESGDETLMFNHKFEKVYDPYKIFDEVYATVFNEIREALRPETVEEVTTASSSGAYVTPKMWAKNKGEMRFAKDTMYPNGKVVDPTLGEGAKLNKKDIPQGEDKPRKKLNKKDIPQGEDKPRKKLARKNFRESNNQKDTAYPEGEFVELDDCTKLNNNKEAQKGGCSVGAVDNVVKTRKTKDSVISSEALYYEVAKKTGRSLDEVKKIIESKKG